MIFTAQFIHSSYTVHVLAGVGKYDHKTTTEPEMPAGFHYYYCSESVLYTGNSACSAEKLILKCQFSANFEKPHTFGTSNPTLSGT